MRRGEKKSIIPYSEEEKPKRVNFIDQSEDVERAKQDFENSENCRI